MLQTTTGQRIAAATALSAHLRLARPTLGRRLTALTFIAVLLGVAPALSGAAAAPSADVGAASVAAAPVHDMVGGPEQNDTPWDRNGS